MCALSLRTWRRNGVACDELLFLPGTEHGALHGVDAPPSTTGSNNGSPLAPQPPPAGEGDVAAGGPSLELIPLEATTSMGSNNNNGTNNNVEETDE